MSSYCENIFHYNCNKVHKLVARKLVDRILLCFAFSHFVIKRRAKQKSVSIFYLTSL